MGTTADKLESSSENSISKLGDVFEKVQQLHTMYDRINQKQDEGVEFSNKAIGLSQQISDIIKTVESKAHDTLQYVNEEKATISLTQEEMQNLVNKVSEVNSFVEIISEIAEQTNLLALKCNN